LIETYTDPFDVVIDPVAGSATTLRAAGELNRSAFGFEIEREFYNQAQEKMLVNMQTALNFDFGKSDRVSDRVSKSDNDLFNVGE